MVSLLAFILTTAIPIANAAPVTAAAEPAPAGWAAAPGVLLDHAEKRPDIFWPVVAVSLPILSVGGLLLLVVKWVLPAWREESEKNRLHLAQLVKQRGDEATADIAANRELSRVEKDAIVSRVENKIDSAREDLRRSSDRIERLGEIVQRLAAKTGVLIMMLAVFGLGAVAGSALAYVAAVRQPTDTQMAPIEIQTNAADCDPACGSGFHCCGHNKCCENKKKTARDPHSAVVVISDTPMVLTGCNPATNDCG